MLSVKMFSLFNNCQETKIVRYRGFDLCVKPGDRVSVKSKRFDCWFDDGYIVSVFTDRITISYAFSKHFGWGFSRGNTKTVYNADINKLVKFQNPTIVRPASEVLSQAEREKLIPEVDRDSSNSDDE